jgi:Fanconi-associated nuclease 1
MVVNSTHDAGHSSLPERKDHHSNEFHPDGASPPAKRLKTHESDGGEDSRGDGTTLRTQAVYQDEIPASDAEGDSDDAGLAPEQPTEFESVLPPMKTYKEAIAEYETMRMVDQDVPEDLKARLGQRSWKKGQSSIYVDAFNLALETVLVDEGHLFEEKEMEIFDQWRELEYEAQYL